MPATLSGLVIAKNEALDLPGCLEALQQVCTEIVVVDNKSQDDTAEIARSAGARVLTRSMDDDTGFAGLRNAGLEEVHTSHVFVMDADERPTDTLLHSIRAALEERRQDTAYSIHRHNNAFDGWLDHGRFGNDRQTRLFNSSIRYTGIVHETPLLAPGTELVELEGDLEHFTYRTLREYIAKMRDYAEKQAQSQNSGPTLKHMLGLPAYNLIVRKGYKDGWRGLAMALGDGWHDHLLRKFAGREDVQMHSRTESLVTADA